MEILLGIACSAAIVGWTLAALYADRCRRWEIACRTVANLPQEENDENR